MVGRLVQDQELRIVNQQRGQPQPGFLPAGERADRRRERYIAQAQPGQNALALAGVHLAAERLQPFERGGVGGHAGVQLGTLRRCQRRR